jgi:hypothetical protein
VTDGGSSLPEVQALLRVLAAGRPAVVSDYAQFADLPARIAVKVPLAGERAEEAEALAMELRRLLADPGRLRAMGEAAREHVKVHHAPERAAAAVVAACREWAELPPLAASTDFQEIPTTPRPSSAAWHDLVGEIEIGGIERPWPEGERRTISIRLRNRGFARWLAGGRGPGGVAVVVKLFEGGKGGHDLLEGRPWIALPRDLDPGEEIRFETQVRRPVGAARLLVEPHMFSGLGFREFGGPWWEGDI